MYRKLWLSAVVVILTPWGWPSAGTIRVPADQPTIQAGIDAAVESDTVLMAPGTYAGTGNIGIQLNGKGIVIRSETGPASTFIDCADTDRAFVLRGPLGNDPVIEGLTIRNGNGGHQGGAIECFGFSPIIRNCVFADNHAEYGGALYANGREGKFAVAINSSPIVENCTFVANLAAEEGSVCFSNFGVAIEFKACLLFSNQSGIGAVAEIAEGNSGTIIFSCSDLWGNAPGDWIDEIAEQAGINGNMVSHPLLCDMPAGEYGIHSVSPLRPENSPCGVLVGALGVSCSDCYDIDGDGLCAADDNCPAVSNADQLDSDGDGAGDVCDDDDRDGTLDLVDNCPNIPNPNQTDIDSDGLGDACDEDMDSDGHANDLDNCPESYNPGQGDSNADGIGDACCCVDRVGDAGGNGGSEPTIGDIVAIIDAKFVTSSCDGVIECIAEADINQSGGCNPTCDDLTIGDIMILICYLFQYCDPGPCPCQEPLNNCLICLPPGQ